MEHREPSALLRPTSSEPDEMDTSLGLTTGPQSAKSGGVSVNVSSTGRPAVNLPIDPALLDLLGFQGDEIGKLFMCFLAQLAEERQQKARLNNANEVVSSKFSQEFPALTPPEISSSSLPSEQIATPPGTNPPSTNPEDNGWCTEPCLDSIQQTVNSLALQARRLAFDESHLSPFSLRARDNGIDTIGGKPDDITILLASVSSKQGHSRETLKTSVARNTSLDHG
ncbi:hypothetical protein ISCGN_007242 [Ixodes scapularis]